VSSVDSYIKQRILAIVQQIELGMRTDVTKFVYFEVITSSTQGGVGGWEGANIEL